jgi:hypothetical protein
MGNIVTTPEERAQAEYRRITKKANRKAKITKKAERKARKKRAKSASVHTVSGGLPSLGKRR